MMRFGTAPGLPETPAFTRLASRALPSIDSPGLRDRQRVRRAHQRHLGVADDLVPVVLEDEAVLFVLVGHLLDGIHIGAMVRIQRRDLARGERLVRAVEDAEPTAAGNGAG